MTINATKTIREIAVENPAATRVFERFGLDYCCGGHKPLAEACADAKLSMDDVVRSLEQATPAPATSRDWKAVSLTDLTNHIVDTHHAYVKSESPRIAALLAKVVRVHGENHPELLKVQESFLSLANELESHMMKEEQMLFPYIIQLDGGYAGQSRFGTVRNPIHMMMMEHDNAGTLLRQIREASADFAAPPDACVSYQTLYRALPEFEADLHQHIHLENNILFPRTIALEAERG